MQLSVSNAISCNIIKTLIVSTVLRFPAVIAVTAAITAAVTAPELLLLFLYNHLFTIIYNSVSFCMVHLFLLKPLKSNFLQFLVEASTGQWVGAIP